MHELTFDRARLSFNECSRDQRPFFAIIPFQQNLPVLFSKMEEIGRHPVFFDFEGKGKRPSGTASEQAIGLSHHPIPYERFRRAFDNVQKEFNYGNSYLLNLTFSTEIGLDGAALLDVFNSSRAPYRCWYDERFVFFSPETFVRIKGGQISTFPVKGTIDAGLKGAAEILRNDPKEKAEHYTVVDLLRNDLGMVCSKVQVDRFAFIEEVHTHKGPLLQMSSEISGELLPDFERNYGDLLFRMLPAGSITGAPKQKTVEIIEREEEHDRTYYTGISVYFDGKVLNSCVNIRYIEKEADGRLVFKSGMGLTHKSEPDKEYDELNRKIYVPLA